MAVTLKGQFLGSLVRVWDAVSNVLDALAIGSSFDIPEERPLSEQYLPEELIEEILSWLPVKALMRFRCVSKSWNSLVFHPKFVKLHLQRVSLNTHLLLPFIAGECWNTRDARAVMLSIPDLLENASSILDDFYQHYHYNYEVCGSCNGLVCLHYTFVEHEYEAHCVRFWNPATRIMSRDSPRIRLGPGNQYKIGFGFDDLSNTYKVVIVSYDIKSENWKISVYCLGDTRWRDVLTCPAFTILEPSNGQFVSGTVNWLKLRSLTSIYAWNFVTIDQLVIFSYDIRSEKYRCLLMPDGALEIPKHEPCLRILKGCLCLFYDFGNTYLSVWIMKEFGVEKSWTRLLKVSYDHLPSYFLLPMWISDNEDFILLESVGGFKFVLFDRRTNMVGSSKVLCKKFMLGSHDYVPSLVLPY